MTPQQIGKIHRSKIFKSFLVYMCLFLVDAQANKLITLPYLQRILLISKTDSTFLFFETFTKQDIAERCWVFFYDFVIRTFLIKPKNVMVLIKKTCAINKDFSKFFHCGFIFCGYDRLKLAAKELFQKQKDTIEWVNAVRKVFWPREKQQHYVRLLISLRWFWAQWDGCQRL